MSIAPITRTAAEVAAVDGVPFDLEIVIPVHNEAEQLAASITTLRDYLDGDFPLSTGITIVDNASTDGTWPIASQLAARLPGVVALHLHQKGRGRALREAWSTSTAALVAYMDVDLATGLDALLPLVAPLLSGHSDVAIGSRLAPGAHVVRGARRECISRGYNLLLRTVLRTRCRDAQCGFKAMRRETAAELLPLVEDQEWFFDTEVLVTAQRMGLRIHEVPVDWVDDLDSRVDVLPTALADLRGVWRMLGPAARKRTALGAAGATRGPVSNPAGRGPARATPVFADELLRFAGVGTVSTVAYAALFTAFSAGLGSYLASLLAIVLCSLGNTAAHRGMAGAARHDLDRPGRLTAGAALLGVSLAATTAALVAVHALGLDDLLSELAAVTCANALAALVRFAILRTWVFRPGFGADGVRARGAHHPAHAGTANRVDVRVDSRPRRSDAPFSSGSAHGHRSPTDPTPYPARTSPWT